jgi:acyl-CoA thioesterase-1
MRLHTLLLTLFALSTGVLTGGCQGKNGTASSPPPQPPASEGTIVAVGDSLTAGYGLPENEAYPARLEQKLQQAGYHWKVVNAGISGETSSGALSRVDWVLKLKPDVVILETGANDGLRGVDPALTRENIDKMVTRLKEQGVIVVLAGMRMFTNMGPAYTAAFADIYPAVAKRHDLILIPFFLSGVAGDPALNQEDRIHPVAKGYGIVTDMVYPYALKAIEQKKKQQHG